MNKPLVSDELWALVAPLLPPEPPKPKGGRPRVSDRACLTGIIFVLRSGIPWEMLPQELGCGSGMTCWRRLRDWQELAIWDLVHFILLDWLARCGRIEMAGRVENRRSDFSLPVVSRLGFRAPPQSGFGLVLFPVPAHRTGLADFPHPALGKDTRCSV